MSGGWNTIESDAVSSKLQLLSGSDRGVQGVFTYLMENLGVQGVQFEELMSLDADSLRMLRYGSFLVPIYPAPNASYMSVRH